MLPYNFCCFQRRSRHTISNPGRNRTLYTLVTTYYPTPTPGCPCKNHLIFVYLLFFSSTSNNHPDTIFHYSHTFPTNFTIQTPHNMSFRNIKRLIILVYNNICTFITYIRPLAKHIESRIQRKRKSLFY